MQKINSWIIAAALMVSLSGTALLPRQSHAMVGVLTGNGALAIAGGCLVGLSVPYAFVAGLLNSGSSPIVPGAITAGVVAGAIIGIILLPNPSGIGYHFEAIRTPEMQKHFGLTDAQRINFNRDRYRINTVVNEIQGKLSAASKLPLEQQVDISKEVWAARLPDFAKETQDALYKINFVSIGNSAAAN